MTILVESAEVRFGGVKALDSVDMEVRPGEVLAVIGPNGSGKTTLFNVITGFVPLVGGRVSLGGHDLAKQRPSERIVSGVSRTFQTPRINPDLSVRETVLCGFYPKSRSSLLAALLRGPAMARTESALRRQAEELLSNLGLLSLADRKMGDLPLGLIRLIDIARAMAARPSYILLDEPAAGLSRSEQAALVEQMKRLAGEGIGVLLVEHNFPLVKSVAANIIVLERGRVVIRGEPGEVSRNPEFVRAYLGSSA